MTRRRLYPLSIWTLGVLVLPLAVVALGLLLLLFTDVGTLPFDNLKLGWITVAVPLAGLAFLYGAMRRQRAIDRFVSGPLAPLLAAWVSPARQAFRAGLAILAVAMIVAAIIGPRWGMHLEKREAYGVDIVVALDVSRSMLAADVRPNRLSAAKREIREQLTERPVFQQSNRVGLLAFAGSTSMKVPLTLDHGFFRTALEGIGVGSAPRGGTAISEAIYEASGFFRSSPEDATKIILVFTDGEDHEGDPLTAAKEVHDEYGIRTFVIGVGDPNSTTGAQVPVSADEPGKPLLHDGQIVFSKLNLDKTRAIAAAGDGQYAGVEDFRHLVDAIAGLQKKHLTTEERLRHRPRYQWFVLAALVLLTLETLLGERKRSIADVPTRTWQEEAMA